MTAVLSVYGRLARDSENVATKSGKPMTTATLAVDQGEGRPTLWVKLIAFGERAEHLTAHGKGDSLSALGRLQMSEWTDREGQARQTLELVVDTLVSARRTPRRVAADAQEPRGRATRRTVEPADAAPLNDDLTF